MDRISKYSEPLKLLSYAIAIAGFFVAKELESRDMDEKINKALDEREKKQTSSSEDN